MEKGIQGTMYIAINFRTMSDVPGRGYRRSSAVTASCDLDVQLSIFGSHAPADDLSARFAEADAEQTWRVQLLLATPSFSLQA